MWQLLSVLRIGLLICVIRRTQSCSDIVEQGKAAEFRCTFSNTTLITWQALAGNNILNLTTCNMASSVCTDQLPSVYNGRVLSSVPGNYKMQLNIASARINETRFRCLTDGGDISEDCGLEVYAPGCNVIVEKGESTHLECPVQGPTNNLTWEMWTGDRYINVTTCSPAGACDQMSQLYNGHINSSGVPQFTLDVFSARSNETHFRCMTDDGKVVKICALEPYRWPSTPTSGGRRLTNQYVDVTFSTVAYPNVQAVLHRRKIDVTNDDFGESYCSRNPSSSDPNSDYIIACTWRIPIANMLLSNTFYVEMSVLVTNQTLVNRPPVVSNDTVTSIGAVDVDLKSCPKEIKKGTSATCTCTISSSGFFNTVQARWFTGNESVVGAVDSSDGSSTLTVSYNPSDPSATYECRGTNPTRQYPHITYQPQFSSSPLGSAITWMLFLLAVCTGLSSTLF